MKIVSLLTVVMCVSILGVGQAYGEDKPQTGPTPSPMPGPAFTAGKQQMFQPVSMDPSLVRQSMQSRSEYDSLNQRIIARQSKLYEENARIKELQVKLRNLQEKIDKLLAEDEELTALKKNLESIAPQIPMGSRKTLPTNAMPLATGR